MNEYLTKKRSSGDYGRQETLPPSLQTKMNQSFGMDFSSVKVYRNDEMAGTGMKGLASGNRVILSKEINLNTLEGQAVLGHELSHIHAQSQGIGMGNSGLYDNAALEHQADTEGRMAAMGQSVYGAPGGMPIFAGMQNMGGLQPLSGGLSANAGAPLQAKKARKRSNAVYAKERIPPFQTEQYDLNQIFSPAPSDSKSKDWEVLRASQLKKNKVPEEIDRAYDTLANRHKNQLSKEQHLAFDDYIADSGPINSVLRGTQKSTPLILSTIDAIDSGMQTTGADLTAFRGVSDFALISVIQQNQKLAEKLLKKDGKIDYKKLEKNPTLLNGLEFTDKGYSSTSVQESFAEKWRKQILKNDAKRITESDVMKKYLEEDLNNKNSSLSGFLSSEQSDEVRNIKTPEDVEKLPKRQQNAIRMLILIQHATEENDPEYPKTTEQDLEDQGMSSHLYEIQVPKNTKGTFVDKMRFDNNGNYTDAGQKELLLDRGTRYKINGIKQLMDENGVPLKNQYRILMEVVGQKHYEVK